MKTIKEGLEGLVLKDAQSTYEPGKRHWLKVKKDYLDEGSMADTADLVVLGAYYGTGNKGGMKSIFLMGCLNEKTLKWQTVTKVANGIDDKTLEKFQKHINMIEINRKENLIPDWLVVNKSMIPDFVVKDPKKSPVWELTGAEFSKSDSHTADGISIRFPRITRFRDDKTWKEATSLQRLRTLYEISKQKSDVDDEKSFESKKKSRLDESDKEEEEESPKKKKPLKKLPVKDKKEEVESENEIPSLFENKKFFINSDVDKFSELKRYIRAYDGEIVDEKLIDEATHGIVNKSEDKLPGKASKSLVKVTADKIWQCIKSKRRFE